MVLFWAAWVNKLMNEVLHTSAFSIGRMGAPTLNERDRLELTFGSTSEWLPQSLHAALWTYSQTVGLITERYDKASKETFGALFEQAMDTFGQASRWEKTGVIDSDSEPLGGAEF